VRTVGFAGLVGGAGGLRLEIASTPQGALGGFQVLTVKTAILCDQSHKN